MSPVEAVVEELSLVGVHVLWSRHVPHAVWVKEHGLLIIPPTATARQVRSVRTCIFRQIGA